MSPPRTFQEPTQFKGGRIPSGGGELMLARGSEIYPSSPMRGGASNKKISYCLFLATRHVHLGHQNSRIFSDEGGYTPLIEMDEEKDEAAKKCLTELSIRMPEFMKWTENCQRWFTERLIPLILDENLKNIKEINKILQYFDKRLHEYEGILKIDQARASDPVSQKSFDQLITIDELLNYESSFRKGGPMWQSSQLNSTDNARANQDLLYHVWYRRQQEKYFEIEGFKTYEIR